MAVDYCIDGLIERVIDARTGGWIRHAIVISASRLETSGERLRANECFRATLSFYAPGVQFSVPGQDRCV